MTNEARDAAVEALTRAVFDDGAPPRVRHDVECAVDAILAAARTQDGKGPAFHVHIAEASMLKILGARDGEDMFAAGRRVVRERDEARRNGEERAHSLMLEGNALRRGLDVATERAEKAEAERDELRAGRAALEEMSAALNTKQLDRIVELEAALVRNESPADLKARCYGLEQEVARLRAELETAYEHIRSYSNYRNELDEAHHEVARLKAALERCRDAYVGALSLAAELRRDEPSPPPANRLVDLEAEVARLRKALQYAKGEWLLRGEVTVESIDAALGEPSTPPAKRPARRCADCGKNEADDCFTVCTPCWEKKYPKPPARMSAKGPCPRCKGAMWVPPEGVDTRSAAWDRLPCPSCSGDKTSEAGPDSGLITPSPLRGSGESGATSPAARRSTFDRVDELDRLERGTAKAADPLASARQRWAASIRARTDTMAAVMSGAPCPPTPATAEDAEPGDEEGYDLWESALSEAEARGRVAGKIEGLRWAAERCRLLGVGRTLTAEADRLEREAKEKPNG